MEGEGAAWILYSLSSGTHFLLGFESKKLLHLGTGNILLLFVCSKPS